MLQSRPIEVGGRCLGGAVTHEAAWRFIALHSSVDQIDNQSLASPAEAGHATARLAARAAAAVVGAAA
jgi:hypothetical protein